MKALAGVGLAVALAGCAEEAAEPCAEIPGCDGAVLCELPADPTLPGPWPVGARTATVDDLTVEIWYPAERGSQRGIDPLVYDPRKFLPDSERRKIPAEDNPWQPCGCYFDLPLDPDHGPYPAIVFIHGTAGFRTQSLEFMTHWASRGFVVLAADHPGLRLADMLDLNLEQDLEGDIDALLEALGSLGGDLVFLQGRLDVDRVGMAGHSAGGSAIATFTSKPGALVFIPMASGGVNPGATVETALILGGMDDAVVPYPRQQDGFDSSPPPKYLVGLERAGHLAFSSLCAMQNAEGQDLVEIAIEHEVKNAEFATQLWDGCTAEHLAPADGWAVVQFATSIVLEETLQCADASVPLSGIQSRFGSVGEYRQAP